MILLVRICPHKAAQPMDVDSLWAKALLPARQTMSSSYRWRFAKLLFIISTYSPTNLWHLFYAIPYRYGTWKSVRVGESWKRRVQSCAYSFLSFWILCGSFDQGVCT